MAFGGSGSRVIKQRFRARVPQPTKPGTLGSDELYAIGHVALNETGAEFGGKVGDEGRSFGLLQMFSGDNRQPEVFGRYINTLPSHNLVNIFGSSQRASEIRAGRNPRPEEFGPLNDFLDSEEGRRTQLSFYSNEMVPEAGRLLDRLKIPRSRTALAHAMDVITQRGLTNIESRVMPFIRPVGQGEQRTIGDLLNAELRGLAEAGTKGASPESAIVSIRRIRGYLKLARGNADAPGFGFDKYLARRLLGVQRGYRLAAKDSTKLQQIDEVMDGLDNPVLDRTEWELSKLREIESFEF